MNILEMSKFIRKGYHITAHVGQKKHKVSIIQNELWFGKKKATPAQREQAKFEFGYN